MEKNRILYCRVFRSELEIHFAIKFYSIEDLFLRINKSLEWKFMFEKEISTNGN